MVDDSVAAHYELGLERDRLFDDGEPRLELTRTLELLDRFLPAAPARLIDVGGGPGAYATVWARRGYDVQLYDLLDQHVQQARQAAAAQPEHSFTAQVADARSIPEPDASADAVVLLGPLYHLTERTQRAEALLEAHRILKPGGVVAAVGISRFAALLPTSTAPKSSSLKSVEPASTRCRCTESKDQAGLCRSTGLTLSAASRCCSRPEPSNRSRP